VDALDIDEWLIGAWMMENGRYTSSWYWRDVSGGFLLGDW